MCNVFLSIHLASLLAASQLWDWLNGCLFKLLMLAGVK